MSDGGVTTGGIDPGDTLAGGSLSFHDALGQPIDPLAVASAFLAFMTAHNPLQARGASDPFDPNPPLAAMLTSLASGLVGAGAAGRRGRTAGEPRRRT